MKVVSMSCSHAPFTDGAAWKWMLKTLAEVKPDVVVHHGDWLDASPVSGFPNEDVHDMADEYDMAARQSREIREVVGPRTKLVRLEGNHEARLGPNRFNVSKRLRKLTAWTNYAPLVAEWSHWQAVPYVKNPQGLFRVGDIVFYHGFDIGSNSDELEALQTAWLAGGDTRLLLVRGHTHRLVPITQARRTNKVVLPYWYANVGHLGPTAPTWAYNRDLSQWGRGLLVGETGKGPGSGWDAEIREM